MTHNLPKETIDALQDVLGDALVRNTIYDWKNLNHEYMAVGSRVTCNPPPTDTDEDWIVFDPNWKVANWLEKNGWKMGGSETAHDPDSWASYTKLDVNVICLNELKEYDLFELSTRVAKELNLMNKDHRRIVFDAIMYGDIKP